MRKRSWLVVFVAAAVPLATVGWAWSEEAPAKKANERERLEREFKEMLTGVVLRGTFQMTNAEGLKGKAPLSKPQTERYAIQSVSKGVDDNWVITAHVKYGDRNATVPVPVRVVWAGDTPVITLDKMKIPMLGTYSARVVIHEGFYGGTWSGAGYGGVLSGQIIKAEDEKRIEKLEKDFEMSMPKKKEKEEAAAKETSEE